MKDLKLLERALQDEYGACVGIEKINLLHDEDATDGYVVYANDVIICNAINPLGRICNLLDTYFSTHEKR